MTGLESLQSVQYVTAHNTRFAILPIDDWEELLEWLETLEDVRIAKEAIRTLRLAGGDRQKAGWLRWEDIREEL